MFVFFVHTNMAFIISFLQQVPPIFVSGLMFLIAYGSVLLFGVLAGKNGLYTIIVLLIIAANIQVLKTTQFSFFNTPVALGTELFAASYLATDILSEIYGPKSAKIGVILGFMGMVFWSLVAILTLGFAPITETQVGGNQFLLEIHNNLEAVLYPIPSFLIASLMAYTISQFLDISIFSYIKKHTRHKYLWIRNNVSTLISALVDNTIFSVLAWIVLSANPLPLATVIKTYILGTYIFRIIAALLDTPIIYIAKKLIHNPKTRL